MLFYSPSTRTRAAFEAGTELLGGHAAYIDLSTTRIKNGEDIEDAAKMYDLYSDAIGIRVLDNAIDYVYGDGRKIVQKIADIAKKPVINLADCTYHPTQALGDIMTLEDKIGTDKIAGKKYVIMWGYSSRLRGRCSVNAEALIATRFGMDVVIAHPPAFELSPDIIADCKKNAKKNRGSFEIVNDFQEALLDADVVFPKSWVSTEMSKIGATAFGVDREIEIHNKYRNWRLTQKHVNDLMKKPAFVTHVLPAYRDEEVTGEVLAGPNSIIYEQAENGFYSKMAVLTLILSESRQF